MENGEKVAAKSASDEQKDPVVMNNVSLQQSIPIQMPQNFAQPNFNPYAGIPYVNGYQQPLMHNGYHHAMMQPVFNPYAQHLASTAHAVNFNYLASPPFVSPVVNPQTGCQEYINESDKLNVKHNSRFNLNPLLCDNILQSDYYQGLSSFSGYNEIIDQIVAKVVHLEPTALGHTLLPSTAFCLLYKLFVLRLSKHQVSAMLSHANNYVKGLGFLYIRFLLHPSEIWGWYKDYLDDKSSFIPGGDGKEEVKMGRFVEGLIVDQKYYSTIFPRIPVPTMRDLKKKILLWERDKDQNEKNEKYRGRFKPGVKIEAEYSRDRKWYKATIKGLNSKNGNFRILFEGYANEEEVPIGKMKLLKRDDSKRSKERRASRRSPSKSRSRRRRRRSHSRSPSKSRSKRRRSSRSDDLDRELEEFIKQRDKEDASAVGRHYANRPVSYKSCLSVPMQIMTTRQRSLTPPTRPSRRASPVRKPRHKDKKVKKTLSKAHLKKLEDLKKIYGDASARKNH